MTLRDDLKQLAAAIHPRFPKVYAFIQRHCNNCVHLDALAYCLKELQKMPKGRDYWSYGNQILKRVDWNYKDEDRQRQGETDRIEYHKIVQAIERLVEHG